MTADHAVAKVITMTSPTAPVSRIARATRERAMAVTAPQITITSNSTRESRIALETDTSGHGATPLWRNSVGASHIQRILADVARPTTLTATAAATIALVSAGQRPEAAGK